MKQTIIKGYKFVNDDLTSTHNNYRWKIGKWNKSEGELKPCETGLHASRTPYDVSQFPIANRLFVVEARGEVVYGENKFVSREMRLIKELPTKKIFVEYAIKCAYRILKNYEKQYPEDKRPRQAINAAKAVLRNPSEENIKAAESAAWATESATRAAVGAAWAVAWAAARAAAWAAWAAESAEVEWQKKTLAKIFAKYENGQ